MTGDRAIVIFDTSGINKLLDTDRDRQAIIKTLKVRLGVWITAISVEEVIATKDLDRRSKLLDLCKELLPLGQCIRGQNFIVRQMARCHNRYKDRFEWRDVDVSFPSLAKEIIERRFANCNEIAKESRSHSTHHNKEFQDLFSKPRGKLRLALDQAGSPSFSEMILNLQADGGRFWKHVAGLYESANYIPITEQDARSFIERCPPFHAIALIIGFSLHGALRSEKGQPLAGRLDQFMAVYLPYCDYFVTADQVQENALKAIASEVGCLRRSLVTNVSKQ